MWTGNKCYKINDKSDEFHGTFYAMATCEGGGGVNLQFYDDEECKNEIHKLNGHEITSSGSYPSTSFHIPGSKGPGGGKEVTVKCLLVH